MPCQPFIWLLLYRKIKRMQSELECAVSPFIKKYLLSSNIFFMLINIRCIHCTAQIFFMRLASGNEKLRTRRCSFFGKKFSDVLNGSKWLQASLRKQVIKIYKAYLHSQSLEWTIFWWFVVARSIFIEFWKSISLL